MNNDTKIRAVIFDMDGVLTNSEPLINAAAIAMFKEKGLEVKPDDFLPFVGMGEERYVSGVAEKYKFPLNASEGKRRTYEIYLDLMPGQLEPFQGVVDLVKACREVGLLISVASSADQIKVRANLKQIKLPVEFWDAVVWGEDVQHKKPAPDIFLIAAGKLGVQPLACVVVEHAVIGVHAAHAAGLRCVAVAQTFPADRLREADIVREGIADVLLSDLAPHLLSA